MSPTWLPLIARVCISLLTRTFFQPDEYFQALEPAHQAVFGFGHLTWEWLSPQPVRSFIFPSLFTPMYFALKALSVEDSTALIWAPKLLTGIFASITDYSTYNLTKSLFGERHATVALFLSLTSVFNTLALSRSLSNSLETSLTILALSYWPFHGDRTANLRKSLVVAALCCAIRPTNAIIWATLALLSFAESPNIGLSVALNAAPIGLATLSLVILVDSWWFGKLTLTTLNFVQTNFSSVSLFYGQNPWHFYITQALPILCATLLPSVILGWYRGVRGRFGRPARQLSIVVSVTIVIYSLNGHKEWRFIHPLLPILHMLASKVLVDSFDAQSRPPAESTTWQAPRVGRKALGRLSIPRLRLYLILATLPLSFYVMRYHGRGQIAAMLHLRNIPPMELRSVGFLMPCHSTPWQAYLHREELEEGRLWALGCEPPLEGQDLTTYRDQAAIFYDDPLDYVETNFPKHVAPSFPPSVRPFSPPGRIFLSAPDTVETWNHSWPSHLVMFDHLLRLPMHRYGEAGEASEATFGDKLRDLGYKEIWTSGWNGWEGDEKRRGPVKIWQFADDSS